MLAKEEPAPEMEGRWEHTLWTGEAIRRSSRTAPHPARPALRGTFQRSPRTRHLPERSDGMACKGPGEEENYNSNILAEKNG